ncbi:hypothetical protein QA649_02505 [Bradyrhizobium sp. CB1717]|uniref:hypothetical protein n=1 Tax=Bradyrhizobium sp. CB1717 TaxID=3039154 RepID=UPI0024B07A53|nr:hypothetical protein [Bradyrhizobium sp. CB1717]WFU25140.1 hypothetical protein QA649_02505 [Bradyrhizobium sp. CB1717]
MDSNHPHLRAAPAFFTSPKCKVAIPVHHFLTRDALAQASLDHSVRAIGYRKAPDLYDRQERLDGIVLNRIDGDFLLSVCRTRPQRSDWELAHLSGVLESNGLRLLERDAVDIRREPLFSNARAVWSHERYHVSVNDRLKIAAALAEDGPQSILELEENARPSNDILAAVCALACEDLVELSIYEAPLGPRTIVCSR